MSENENEQQIQVGKRLREARQAKGYTLDDLQQLTKIQKRYLIAIEDEKFDELPGDFYVRAFIKQYADTVGLDGNELLKEFNEQLPKAKTEEYSDHISQAVETRANRRKTVSQGVSKVRQYMPTIIIACVIVIVLAAIWVTAIVRGHQDASTKIDNSSVSVSGESRKKSSSSAKKHSAKSAKKNTAIKLTEASRNNNSVTYNAASLKKDTSLQIKTTGRAWNSVTVDGTSALSRTMDAKSTANVAIKRTANTVVITVGNAPATTLKIGNKKINFTNNGRYNNTRTVTIHFGNSSSSSTSTSSSSSRVTNNGQSATQRTTTNQTTQRTTTTPTRNTTSVNQSRTQGQTQNNQTQSR